MTNASPLNRSETGSPPAIGRHVLLDLFGVDDARLCDAEALTHLLERILDQAGFHRLDCASHQFFDGGHGATAMVLLSESHATIHTYPEHQYAAVDVFSCGSADLDQFVDDLIKALRPVRVERFESQRGAGLRSR